ncbi:MAG: hypothetical protein HOP28_01265 [Gemmatimonadales bacterium]|nr:hypothetical protein [Gemmatimonadales bacterium]
MSALQGWRRAPLWFTIGLVGVACRQPPVGPSQSRDSAGVRIVENDRASGPVLAFDSLPVVDIGPGSAGEFFSPISAVRLSDGRIVAAGWATTELKVFDRHGRLLATVGRKGGGPGEFEALGWVYRGPGDSLVTFEPGTQRLQRWSPAPRFSALGLLVSPGGRPTASLRSVLADGSLLVSTRLAESSKSGALTARGWITLFRARTASEPWDSLFSFLSGLTIRHPANPNWSIGQPLLAPIPSYHQSSGGIVYAAGDRFEVHLLDMTGRLRMIVRRKAEPRAVSSREFEQLVESRKPNVQHLARLLEVSTSRVRPAVAAVWLSQDGRTWAEFGEPGIGERRMASVFDSTGRWESDVPLPIGAQVLQIDRDGLLASMKDADGFYHLQFYPLRVKRAGYD